MKRKFDAHCRMVLAIRTVMVRVVFVFHLIRTAVSRQWESFFRVAHRSTVNMAPGRYGPWSIWPTLSLYGPSRWSIWPTPCQYDPPLVDIAKTVIARLCYINYNIAIIVRKLEGWLEGPKCVPHPTPPAIWE